LSEKKVWIKPDIHCLARVTEPYALRGALLSAALAPELALAA
jgi:hypothetical protein